MGRGSKSIIITKGELDSSVLKYLAKSDINQIGTFKCYTIYGENTYLSERAEDVRLPKDCYLLESDGYSPFTWKLWWEGNRCSKNFVDTFYESEESIKRQIDMIMDEANIVDTKDLVFVLTSLLKTNKC